MKKDEGTIKTLIIDDHPLFRRGLGQLLAMDNDFVVVGEAASGEEGIQLAEEKEPDLVLLDLNMRGLNGIETLMAMRQANLDARIIILTVSNSAENLVSAIRAGCDGYILKDTDPEDMMNLIRMSMHGQNAISPELSSVLANMLRQESAESRTRTDLTDREMDVLKCLAQGMSNKLIAREFDIVESTVKIHIRNILKKLKFRSRVEAAVWAVSNNIGGTPKS